MVKGGQLLHCGGPWGNLLNLKPLHRGGCGTGKMQVVKNTGAPMQVPGPIMSDRLDGRPDGVYYKDAIAAHQDPRKDPDPPPAETYRSTGFTYLKDGATRWERGAKLEARALAGAYESITCRTPLFPIYKPRATTAASLAGV